MRFVTGNGLKDSRSALAAAPRPIELAPDLNEVEKALAP